MALLPGRLVCSLFVVSSFFLRVAPQEDRHQRADERYPHSELLLYKNLALSDAGMTQEALDHLEAIEEKVRQPVRRRAARRDQGEGAPCLPRRTCLQRVFFCVFMASCRVPRVCGWVVRGRGTAVRRKFL